MNEDERWMKVAISEANLAINEGEIPVGAVLIQNGKLVAKAHNQPILNHFSYWLLIEIFSLLACSTYFASPGHSNIDREKLLLDIMTII